MYTNVLIIIDDLIADLYENKTSRELKELVFNRRHLLTNGMVSIILTSQKYSLVRNYTFLNKKASPIRSNLTLFFTFRLNNVCLEKIKKEIITIDTRKFGNIVDFVFAENTNFLICKLVENKFFKNFKCINL